jgi:signal transduction histidine kinase
MRIGGRLLLLLAVPLVGLLAVTGYGVVSGVLQARDASALQERTDLALVTYDLIDALQAERSALVDGVPTPPEARDAVQAGKDAVAARSAEIGGEIAAEAERALVRVDAAQRVDALGLGARAAMGSHSAAIDRLLDLSTMAIDPGGAIDGAPAETANNLARAQAASAQERDLVVVVAGEGDLSARSFQELTSLAAAQRSYALLAASTAPSALAVQIERVGHGINASDAVRRDVFSEPEPRDYSTWIAGLESRTVDLDRLQGEASTQAVDAVDDLATSSRVLLVLAALAAIATVLITVLLLRRAVRSISRPLEELAAQAEDVARTRLPAAVKAQQADPSDDAHLPALRATGAAEVHDVAAAFNDVQDTALRLASEQAALRVNQAEALTNLGRRNQTLLARQLDFISSLETKETDPAFLEHLFKLDHLASRMRRNAESLLILAGSETPRRRRAPAQVSEVIRASMSEVEEFERVRIGHLREATLTGPVVIDLIHLLAEIIENALGFSPPDTTVEIDGRSLGQGGYQFAVIDHGVGMTDVELVAANQRLAGLDELEGMPTRYLGQYVVAKLAAKTGAMVRLQPSSGGRGVTALVILPSSAVVGEPDRSNVASPLPGSRASREQGPEPFAPGAGVTAAVVDGSPVIETTVVPDLRDRPSPFDSAITDPAPTDAPLSTGPSAASSAGVGDAPSWSDEPVPTGQDASDEPSWFDSTPESWFASSEPADAESSPADTHAEVAPASDATAMVDHTTAESGSAADPWAQFSRNVFDDPGSDTTAPPPAPSFEAAPAFEAAPSFDAAGTAEDDLTVAATVFDAARDAGDQQWWTAPDAGDAPHADGNGSTPDPATPFAPPPAPQSAPDQPDWSPLAADGAEGPNPFSTDASPTTRVPIVPPAETPSAPAAEAPVPAGVGAAPATPGRSGPGGLARRVPGASLAESRTPGPADAPAPPVDRSADNVRSMLSAFQAGRSRGRSGAPAAPDAAPDTSSAALDSPQDGRSTR